MRSLVFRSRLLVFLPVLIACLALMSAPASAAPADTVTLLSSTFSSDTSGWTFTSGGFTSGAGSDGAPGYINQTGQKVVGTSASFSAPGGLVSGSTLSLSLFAKVTNGGGNTSLAAPTLNGVAATAWSCSVPGSGTWTQCSGTFTPPTPGTASSLAISWDGTGSLNYPALDTVLLTGTTPSTGITGATGSVSYPTVDTGSLSTQMAAFFAFIAPALYIVAGIGLGGLIVGKVRHLF